MRSFECPKTLCGRSCFRSRFSSRFTGRSPESGPHLASARPVCSWRSSAGSGRAMARSRRASPREHQRDAVHASRQPGRQSESGLDGHGARHRDGGHALCVSVVQLLLSRVERNREVAAERPARADACHPQHPDSAREQRLHLVGGARHPTGLAASTRARSLHHAGAGDRVSEHSGHRIRAQTVSPLDRRIQLRVLHHHGAARNARIRWAADGGRDARASAPGTFFREPASRCQQYGDVLALRRCGVAGCLHVAVRESLFHVIAPAPVSLPRLWFGLFGAPAAWALQLIANYAIVAHACYPATVPLAHPVIASAHELAIAISFACLLVAVSALLAARGSVRQTSDVGRSTPADTRDARPGRTHFMAVAGLIVSVLFTFAVLMSSLP